MAGSPPPCTLANRWSYAIYCSWPRLLAAKRGLMVQPNPGPVVNAELSVARVMKLPIYLLLLAAPVALISCIVDLPTASPTATPELAPIPSPTATRELSPTAAPTGQVPSTPTSQVSVEGGAVVKQYSQPPPMTINRNSTYTADIRTNKGPMTIELFASEAPVTVNNFVFLAQEGFYDGVVFHRVIKDFMVQTGDPTGTGAGGPGYLFDDEPVTRGYSRGIVAMANSGPNTNGSQFFIVHGANVGLRPDYTIFGRVVQGIDTLDALAIIPVTASPRGELSVPTEVLRIETIEISESN